MTGSKYYYTGFWLKNPRHRFIQVHKQLIHLVSKYTSMCIMEAKLISVITMSKIKCQNFPSDYFLKTIKSKI